MCVCVRESYLLGKQPPGNLVALNNENSYYAHEPEVWSSLGADEWFYYTRRHLGQLKGWALESSEILLIRIPSGWCHLSAEC